MRRLPAVVLIVLWLHGSPRPAVRAQGSPPELAASRMTVAEGLEVHLVAAEPLVRQPVAIEFDDRGRLWVIQYMQYPNPAGLKRVRVDRYSRTDYDRIPEPPPRGPRGQDRVTILEDTDGDGRADRAKDFVANLNLASGLAFGYGGVFILQTPYLLFYPDRDRDDRPDADPEVLLTGFGMEDAHSVANSLTWGPDGWLYGLQGSTVTARVRGIEFQQGIWRFHPRSRRFELFCEGGGNMWGLDFDRRGQLFASTNVGGFALLYGVQGGYYWKAFGKHGPLHNPFAFGYFDHVSHEGLRGGHVAVGGMFYEAENWQAAWHGRYIAADLLDHSIHGHEVKRDGSTFRASQVGDVLRANDTWFAPSDQTLGPDGALYVSDWHDQRTAHPDPDAEWDRSNGRIFTIRRRGSASSVGRDLNVCSDDELIRLLDHANVWYRRKARRLLAERQRSAGTMLLERIVMDSSGTPALEALWALYGIKGLDEGLAERLLKHRDADVRGWTVRLLGDDAKVSPRSCSWLVELARREPDVTVRAQLSSTARRLPPTAGLDVAQVLLARDLDSTDRHVPLLLWWVVEHHALADLEDTVRRFTAPAAWASGLTRSAILPHLMRRLALEGSGRCDRACARLLASAPAPAEEMRQGLLVALEEAARVRATGASPVLAEAVASLARRSPADLMLIRLAARWADSSALTRMRKVAADPAASRKERLAMIELVGELRDRGALGDLQATAQSDDSEEVRLAALAALGRFTDEELGRVLVDAFPRQKETWRSRASDLLLGRVSWAKLYLEAIDRGTLGADQLSLEQLGRFPALRAPALAALVRKRWGLTRGVTPEDRLAEIRRLNNDLRAAPGDPELGRALFRQKCGTCHRLNGEGELIGPDLTFANRQDRDFLLTSLVDPGGVVRKEYQSFVVETRDGRVLGGLITEQSPGSISLRDAKGVLTRIPRAEIAEMKESDASMMPESLYKEFSPQQLRDLFSFLQAREPSDHRGRP